MPVRNGAEWIGDAVESILSQTISDFELLVVDDGSTDRTVQIVEKYQRQDQRVRLHRQPESGLVAALNLGLSRVAAPLVARLDADDIANPDRLRRQVDYMDANPDVTLLGTWAEKIDEHGKKIGRMTASVAALNKQILKDNPFVHSSVVFRSDLVKEMGGYRAAFEAAEDYDLWLRLSELGTIAILPELHVRYRIHSRSVSSRRVVRQLFSVRLAQRAAACRRSGVEDPTSSMTSPPNWDASTTGFFALEARLSRFLARVDPEPVSATPPHEIDMDILRQIQLTHKERKLAQRAIVNVLANSGRSTVSRSRLIWTLLRLHPLRAAALLLGRSLH